jgi:hypothetical protein
MRYFEIAFIDEEQQRLAGHIKPLTPTQTERRAKKNNKVAQQISDVRKDCASKIADLQARVNEDNSRSER